jgi:PAS domain S-box-containing protein
MSIAESLGPEPLCPACATRYRTAHLALEQSNSLLRATLESTADGLLVVDLEGRIVSTNAKFAQMWGIAPELLESGDDRAVLGSVLASLEDPDAFVARVAALYADPEAESFDVVRFRDGRIFERYSQPQRLDGRAVGRVWSFRDATARYRAEEELRGRERQLAETQRVARLGSWRWDVDVDRFTWSDELSRIHGVEPGSEPTTFDACLAHVHPDDLPRVRDEFQRLQVEGGRFEFEARIVRPGGTVRVLRTVGEASLDAEGRPVRVVGASQDISEQRFAEEARTAAEAARRRSETRFRTMFEQFPLSVQIFAPDGRTLEVNRAWHALFGLPPEALAAFNPLTEPQLEAIRPLMQRGFAGEAVALPPLDFHAARVGIPDDDAIPGEPLWVQAFLCPVTDDDGAIREVIIVHQDVTESRRAEEALAASEASYRAIFDSSNDAIFVHDVETGEIVDANRRACELLGRTRDAVLAMGPAALVSEEPGYELSDVFARLRAASEGMSEFFEWRAPHADGRSTWVEVGLRRVVLGGFTRLLATARDITERKAAETALRLANDELERRVEERTGELAETNLALEEEIAERARAEEELRRTSAAMEAVLHALPDRYVRLDRSGTVLEFRSSSQSHEDPADLVGRSVRDAWTAESAERIIGAMAQVQRTGELETVEYTAPADDGDRDFEARLVPLPDGEIISIIRDVTAAKQAERELQRSEEQFRTLIENGSDLIIVVSPEGNTTYLSPSGERLLGWPEEERLGRSSFEMIHPDDIPAAAKARQAAVDNPGRPFAVEFRYRHKDGSMRTFEAIVRTLLPDSADGGLVVNARDVTGRKAIEAALQESEAHFRTLIENASDVATVLEVDGTVRYQSPSIQRVLGYTSEELVGRAAFDLVHPDDVPRTRQFVQEIIASPGIIHTLELRFRHRSGDWRVLESLGKTLDPDTADAGVVVNSRDVTDRREAEAALQRSEEHFRTLIENASDLITILDPDGIIRYESSAIERLFGYTTDELVGRNPFELVHPHDVDHTLAAFQEVVANPGQSTAVQFRFRRRDGSWRFLEAVGRTLDPVSAAEGVVINSRDITERKEAEAALRQSEEHFRTLIENSYDLVQVLDVRGQIEYTGPSVSRLLGYTADEIVGGTVADFIHPEDQEHASDFVRKLLADPGTSRSLEYRVRHRDGSWRWLETYGRTLTTNGEPSGVVANARDVTERKESEEALQAAMREAERANRAKSEFLSRMSHELRTPMNSILGFAQLLARRDLPPDQARSLDHILKAGRHLLNLINEVLDISRIEANRHHLSVEPVRVQSAVDEAVSLIRPLAAQHGCEVDPSPIAPGIYVHADRQRLAQILLNLLSNAVKYNRPGGRVWVTCDPVLDDDARVTAFYLGVNDTGPGIPADRIDELFVPFARLGAEQSEVEGTGLGLALSSRLAEAMGGELSVSSTPGVGTTFRLTLIAAEDPLHRLPEEAVQPAPRGPEDVGRAATVLYIEDNLANLTLIETILAGRPEITLVPALQGRLGLDLACQHAPDLILLDLHLPDIPGDEVLARLRGQEATRDTPVVIISADATPRRIARLREAGVHAYLTKPLDVDEFLETLDSALAQRKA